MFLSDWLVLVRRWYVVLVGLAATGGLCLVASKAVPVTYTATAQIVLVPPTATEGDQVNPFMGLGGLESMADVVSRAMQDDQMTAQLVADGVGKGFTVEPDPTAAAPVLIVTTPDATPQKALDSLRLVVDQVPRTTGDIQARSNVDDRHRISAQQVSKQGPDPDRKSQVRAVFAAGAAGLALTVFAAAAVDALARRRRRRKAERRAVAAAEAAAAVAALMPMRAVMRVEEHVEEYVEEYVKWHEQHVEQHVEDDSHTPALPPDPPATPAGQAQQEGNAEVKVEVKADKDDETDDEKDVPAADTAAADMADAATADAATADNDTADNDTADNDTADNDTADNDTADNDTADNDTADNDTADDATEADHDGDEEESPVVAAGVNGSARAPVSGNRDIPHRPPVPVPNGRGRSGKGVGRPAGDERVEGELDPAGEH
jgi:hypothetical protein